MRSCADMRAMRSLAALILCLPAGNAVSSTALRAAARPALVPSASPRVSGAMTAATATARPKFMPSPEAVAELTESATKDMLDRVEAMPLDLPSYGVVEASFVRTGVAPSEGTPPVVLLHGFDSSCLEFRRTLPKLEALGVEAYALDLLGWGFGDTGGGDVSVEAKRAALLEFRRQVLGDRQMTLLGVSLGAAVVIDFNAVHSDAVASAILVDPQGFIDGAPPVPEPFARGGIRVLGSWPLRSLANQLAYADTDAFATDDAIRVGLLHCARPSWEDDSVSWLLGGGYSVSSLVPRLAPKPTAILWGRQDEILPPAEFAPKFVAALPGAAFRWVEECGHSPHLEQPDVLAAAVRAFLDSGPDAVAGDDDVSEIVRLANRGALEKLADGVGRGGARRRRSGSPAERFVSPAVGVKELDAFLDTPILDPNERGGPLEPLKAFVWSEPETAQVAASVLALTFFFVLARGLVAVLG